MTSTGDVLDRAREWLATDPATADQRESDLVDAEGLLRELLAECERLRASVHDYVPQEVATKLRTERNAALQLLARLRAAEAVCEAALFSSATPRRVPEELVDEWKAVRDGE